MKIELYLDDLESRLDEEQEEKLLQDYHRFVERKMNDRSYFRPQRDPAPSAIEWEKVLYNDTIEDYDKMLYKQLLRANDQLENGGGELLSYRASFGTGLIPSMFGCKIKLLPYQQDSLPGVGSLPWETVKKINEDYRLSIRIDVRSGLGQKAIDAAHHAEKLLADYPKLNKYLHIYQPDTQGPCSLAESIIGSDFYTLIFEEDEEVSDFIDVITDAFIRYMKEWKKEFPYCDSNYAWDYGLLYKGGIMIREDAATNISSNMYENFFMESDQRILDAFGGGAVHFCGKGDHLLPSFSSLNGLTAVNMSQPDMNDMDGIVYPNTIDKDIQIIGMPKFEVRRCDRHNINLKGMVHVGVCVAAWMGEPETDPRGEDC